MTRVYSVLHVETSCEACTEAPDLEIRGFCFQERFALCGVKSKHSSSLMTFTTSK